MDKSNLSPDLNMESLGQLSFVKIKGLANFWEGKDEKEFDFDAIMSDMCLVVLHLYSQHLHFTDW